MPEGATLRVEGYRELMRAFALADKASRKALRETLRKTGGAVRADAAYEIDQHPDRKSAAGIRVIVRRRGVSVEQVLRKTSGLHPEWGAWQMRHALVPALDNNREITNARMEAALDAIASGFNAGGPL